MYVQTGPSLSSEMQRFLLYKFLLNIPYYLFHPRVNRSLWKFWWKRMDAISTHLHCGLPLALAPSPVCFSDDNVKSVIKKNQNRLKLTTRLPLYAPMRVHSSAAQLRITVELLKCHVSLVTEKIWRLNFCPLRVPAWGHNVLAACMVTSGDAFLFSSAVMCQFILKFLRRVSEFWASY